MTNLRKAIILLSLHLMVVFNLERLDVPELNVVDVQGFLYPLILLVVFLTLFVSALHQASVYFSLTLWLGIYFALHLVVFRAQPLVGGVYTYLTITELAFLTVTVFLAYDLAQRIREYETVIEQVTLPKTGRKIYGWTEASEDIKSEFVRSRRHNRSLSLMVVEPAGSTLQPDLQRPLRDLQKMMVNRYLSASLAQLISKEARRTDMIVEQEDHNSFILLCPETTQNGASIFAERIQAIAKEKLGVPVSFGIASFPEDAITFDDLLQKAKFNQLDPSKLNYPTYDQASKTDNPR